MKKILSLTQDNLGSGVSPFIHDTSALWYDAQGFNPFLNSVTYNGLFAAGTAPSDITGSLTGTPFAATRARVGADDLLYVMTSSGDFARVSTTPTVTIIRNGADVITNPVAGMAIFQPRAASTATLFYWRTTHIGSWDMSGTYPTGWSDTARAIEDTTFHPVHRLFDRIYYGNKYKVGVIYDDGTSTPNTATTNSLDFEANETVTAIGDDGRYLIVATTNVVTTASSPVSKCRIVFWDTSADTWEWEATVDDYMIRGIKATSSGIYAIGETAIWQLQFGMKPRRVKVIPGNHSIPVVNGVTTYPQCITEFTDGIMFGAVGAVYARPTPSYDRIYYTPLRKGGSDGDFALIVTDFIKDKVLVGTRESKLFSHTLTTPSNSTSTASTVAIPLNGLWSIEWVHLEIPRGIAASDAITIGVSDTATSAIEASVTYTATNTQTYKKLKLPKHVRASHARVHVTITGGSPGLSAIHLYGTPATE